MNTICLKQKSEGRVLGEDREVWEGKTEGDNYLKEKPIGVGNFGSFLHLL